MKRWKIVLPSLIATASLPLASLVGCGDEPHPVITLEFKQDGVGEMSDYKTATVSIDWTPSEDSIILSQPTFSTNEGTVDVITCKSKEGSRPCEFEITFESDITDNITDGIFGFHYEDITTGLSDSYSIENIQINKFQPILVESVCIDQAPEVDCTTNKTTQLTATITPNDATDKTITWEVIDGESYASVNNDGLVTGKKEGYATIQVKTRDGDKTATCRVHVKDIHVTGVSINEGPEVDCTTNKTTQLTATITPNDATDKAVTWDVIDGKSYASVNNEGLVTGLAEGNATIQVKTRDGDKTATCIVHVKDIHVAGVSLNQTSIEDNVGKSVTLKATVLPAEATNKNVLWSSGNTKVATVDEKGEVSLVGEGDTTITATTEDGGFTATCTVHAQQAHVTGVTINEGESWNIYKDKSYQLTCTVEPAEATDKSVTWSIKDKSVAKIDKNGKITAVADGTTTVTVTTNDGHFTDTLELTVFSETPQVDEWIDQDWSDMRYFDSNWLDCEANQEYTFGFECEKLILKGRATGVSFRFTNSVLIPSNVAVLLDNNTLINGEDYYLDGDYRFTKSAIDKIYNSAFLIVKVTFDELREAYVRIAYQL